MEREGHDGDFKRTSRTQTRKAARAGGWFINPQSVIMSVGVVVGR